MADIWYDVDAALAEVPINIAPLTDDTDFKSREVSLTYNQAGLDLVWNFVTTSGAFTQTAVTPTDTGGAYDWVNQGKGYYTIEIPASGGASINNDTEGFGWFTGYATGVLPWRGPILGFRAAGLNNLLIDDAYSTTRGLAGTALPAAAADAAGGLPISDAGALDLDVKLANTNEITVARMGALTDWINGGRLDLILDATATAAELAKVPKSDSNVTWNATALASINAEVDTALNTAIPGSPTADSINERIVAIDAYGAPPTAAAITDAVWDEELTAATHNVATSSGRRVRQLASTIIYDGTLASATANTAVLDSGASSVNGSYDPGIIAIMDGTGAGQSRLILQYTGATRTAALDRDWKVIPDNTSTYVLFAAEGREHVNEGLAQAGAAATITLNANASASDNEYIGQVIFIRSGTGADQARRITAYNGTTKVATVYGNWNVTPDATSGYVMLPSGVISTQMIADSVWDEATASHVTAGTTGLAVGSITSVAKKNTALANFAFIMTDSTNHETATSKTVTCTRSIDGGAFAAGSLANVTEVSDGVYNVDFLAADLNGDVIVLKASATGCDDTFVTIVTAK